jgi:hypothetical protein
MYTKDELLDLTASEVREIAELMELEYTTKAPTIDAILSKQNTITTETPVENVNLFTPPVVTKPVTPVVMPPKAASGYYAKLGIPLGNDGDKIRHRLDGTRIN